MITVLILIPPQDHQLHPEAVLPMQNFQDFLHPQVSVELQVLVMTGGRTGRGLIKVGRVGRVDRVDRVDRVNKVEKVEKGNAKYLSLLYFYEPLQIAAVFYCLTSTSTFSCFFFIPK